MKKLFVNNIECCGCGACENICPQNAIFMQEDGEGFLYPYIYEEKCINCGLCDMVCPEKNKSKIDGFQEKCFAGYSKNAEEVRSSASGGLASALAHSIIDAGGIVYGVVYNDTNDEVLFMRAEEVSALNRFKGSKYVQAHHGKLYTQIKQDLEAEKTVLFIGLPCEVNALRLYLKKSYDNLYACSLICHGPTSQKVHRQFISEIKPKGSDVTFFTVRHKINACKPYYIKAVFSNGHEWVGQFHNSTYGKAFRFMKRPSCNYCTFKRGFVQSDLTLGDFHYGYALKNKINNPMGISIAIVHTLRGSQLLNIIDDFYIDEVLLKQTLRNEAYVKAIAAKSNRKEFGKVFSEKGLEKACSLASVKRVENKEKLRVEILTFLVKMKRKLLSK